ncbi:MAG: M23 family metallopeptidase [Lachnospirales bacterium]
MDIAVEKGTEVKAVKTGQITKAGFSNSYGNYIGYKTYDGYDLFYAHLDSVKSKVGDVVEKGEVIAYSGSTGQSTGPHLHYEIEKDQKQINPDKYISLK